MNSAFENELRKHIEEQLVRLRSNLETPGAITDYTDYKLVVGQIFALKRVVEIFDDINRTINSR